MKADDFADIVRSVMDAGRIQKCAHDKLEPVKHRKGVHCPSCEAVIIDDPWEMARHLADEAGIE